MNYPQVYAFILLLLVPQLAHAQKQIASGSVPPPQFAGPQRKQKLAAAFPEIERLFKNYMERQQPPGAVLGVIIDGELVWVKPRACVRKQEMRLSHLKRSFASLL
jgi:hypothetical protein